MSRKLSPQKGRKISGNERALHEIFGQSIDKLKNNSIIDIWSTYTSMVKRFRLQRVPA